MKETDSVSALPETPADEARALKILRRALFGILAFGLGGSAFELWLLEHTEGFWQKVPLALIGLSFAAMMVLGVVPRKMCVRIFQFTMLLLLAGGVAGLALHFKGNMEFELEMHPGQTGMKLYWETLKGATPALAPGLLLLLGSLGFACTYHHPALGAPLSMNNQPKGS